MGPFVDKESACVQHANYSKFMFHYSYLKARCYIWTYEMAFIPVLLTKAMSARKGFGVIVSHSSGLHLQN